MQNLNISITDSSKILFPIHTKRQLINIKETDFSSVSGVILTKQDLDWAKKIDSLKFNLPIILVLDENDEIDTSKLSKIKFAAIIDNAKKI